MPPEASYHPMHEDTLELVSELTQEDLNAIKDLSAIKRTSKIMNGLFGALLVAIVTWTFSLNSRVVELEKQDSERNSRIVNLDRDMFLMKQDAQENYRLDAAQQQVLLNVVSQLERIEVKLDKLFDQRK